MVGDANSLIAPPTSSNWSLMRFPHNDGANYVCVDGHAKWHTESDVEGNWANYFPAVR